MSNTAIKWARKQHAPTRSAQHLLFCLADWADDNAVTWRSKATIAREMGTAKSNICRWLAELRRLGLVEVVPRYRNGAQISSVIILHVDAGATDAKPNKTACLTHETPPVSPVGHKPTLETSVKFTGSRKEVGRERLSYTREGVTRTHADVSANSSVSMRNAAEAAGADFEAVSGYPSREGANARQRAATELLGAIQPRPLGWSAALLARAAAVEPVPEPVIPSGWDCDGEGF